MRFGGPVTPAVKLLLVVNFSIFIIQQITGLFSYGALEQIFGLSHNGLVYHHFAWQLVTYMFFHGGWLHIFFNLFALWMFAGELEQLWGTKAFLKYYLLSGIGAGVFIALMNAYFVSKNPDMMFLPTLGASGALYALLLAYGMIWPNREVLVYFLFPVKIKYVVIFFGLLEFFGTLSSAQGKGDSISHIGHLGGLITGFIILQIWKKHSAPKGRGFLGNLARKWRLRRKQKEINTRIKAKETIDLLLEKIARQGMASLTAEEKIKLEWARKHYYPNDDETIH